MRNIFFVTYLILACSVTSYNKHGKSSNTTFNGKSSETLLGAENIVVKNCDELSSELHQLVEIMDKDASKTPLTCEFCKRQYKTQFGYQRHLRKIHDSFPNENTLTDGEIEDLLRHAKVDLSDDMCHTSVMRNTWRDYVILTNPKTDI